MNTPFTTRVAIIGGGFAALMAYVVLRFRGLSRDEIVVISPDASPEKSWEKFARAINLKNLRSESVGHFYPTDSPGLATVQAVKTYSLRPILASWFDRYHPTVEFFIRHTKAVAGRTGYYQAVLSGTVGNIERYDNHFAISSPTGELLGWSQHVILAIGHGRLRQPESIAKFRTSYPGDTRVTLSYEPKTYARQTVLVLGDGITAATEWANVLQAGGAVAAASLDGFDLGQPLQVPRRYFSHRGLAPYRQKMAEERIRELKTATRGTIPLYSTWRKLFGDAEEEGRLGLLQGVVKEIRPGTDGRLECEIEIPEQKATHTVTVDQVICATGFLPATTHPLLAALIEKYQLATEGGVLQTDDNCCIEALSTDKSVLALVGPAAAWAVPCSDSLGGMKIASRLLANLIVGKESLRPRVLARKTPRWARLIIAKELV